MTPKAPEALSISFRGSAWLMIYHLGAVKHLRERCDMARTQFAGASSGAVTAASAATDIPTEQAKGWVIRRAEDSRRRFLGPVGRMTRYVEQGLDAMLPEDAHIRATGRLHVAVTTLPRFRALRVSSFGSRAELIRVLLASCYIPVYYERPIMFRGRPCIDGGLTDNCPSINAATITISPRRGPYDICPNERFPRRFGLFPPDTETLERLFALGYDDCRRWDRW